jgi:hypothetical protein
MLSEAQWTWHPVHAADDERWRLVSRFKPRPLPASHSQPIDARPTLASPGRTARGMRSSRAKVVDGAIDKDPKFSQFIHFSAREDLLDCRASGRPRQVARRGYLKGCGVTAPARPTGRLEKIPVPVKI